MPEKKGSKKRYNYFGFPPILVKKKIISMKEILNNDINSKSK